MTPTQSALVLEVKRLREALESVTCRPTDYQFAHRWARPDGYTEALRLTDKQNKLVSTALRSPPPEAVQAMEELIEAVKFYAGESADAEWDGPKLLTFDKFGSLDADIMGPYIAKQALARYSKATEGT